MQPALSATAYGHTFAYAWLGTQKQLPSPKAVVACHCWMTILLRGCGVTRAMAQKNAEYTFTALDFHLPYLCWFIFTWHFLARFLPLRVHRELLILKIQCKWGNIIHKCFQDIFCQHCFSVCSKFISVGLLDFPLYVELPWKKNVKLKAVI